MINRVVLMGRLTADPELKTTQSGLSVTSFAVAVDRNYVRQGEERKADFINIVCWRQTAEFVCRYFGKGSMIALEGRIQTRQYQAKDGSNRYVTEVVADSVSFTGERREENNQGGYGGNYQAPQRNNQPQNYGGQSYGDPQAYGGDRQGYIQGCAQNNRRRGNAPDIYENIPDDDLPF